MATHCVRIRKLPNSNDDDGDADVDDDDDDDKKRSEPPMQIIVPAI